MSGYTNFYRIMIDGENLLKELDGTGYGEITTHGEVSDRKVTHEGNMITTTYTLDYEGEKCFVTEVYDTKKMWWDSFKITH